MKPLLLPPLLSTLLSALLLPAALPLTCSQDLFAASALRFTAIPDENTARLTERFDKVAAYLTEKTGVDVEYVPVKSYAASVAAFKNDEVQLAWFGGLSGVKARRSVPGSVAIAQGEEDVRFVTYFIANTSTGIDEGEDFPDAVTRGLRRGADMVRGVLERTRGDLTLALRQHRLEERMSGFEDAVEGLQDSVGGLKDVMADQDDG